MSQCADMADIAKTINSPTGANPRNAPQPNPFLQNSANPILNAAKVALERADAEEVLSATNTSAPVSIEQPTVKDTRIAHTVARDVADVYGNAKMREQERINELNDNINTISGTSIGSITWWNNLQSGAHRWFANQRGAFHKYILRFARQEGRQNFEHPVNQTLDQLPRLIAGQSTIFRQRIEAFDREVFPHALKQSMSVDDMCHIIGDYAQARDTPAENAFLIKRWRQHARDLDARWQKLLREGKPEESPAMRGLQREARNYEARAARLEENLEVIGPENHLLSCGYTNAEARVMQEKKLKESGLSREQMEYFSNRLAEEYHFILNERATKGALSPETLASFPPELQNHIPKLSLVESNTGPSNDASIFNPGHYHAMEGRSSRPDDAYSLLSFYSARAATEIGTQRMGLQLAALEKSFIDRYGMEAWRKLPQTERTKLEKRNGEERAPERYARNMVRERFGITSIAERDLIAQLNSTEQWMRKQADNIYNVGGIVIDVPSRAKDGSITNERRLYWFDANWHDAESNITGPALNEALSSNYKLGTGWEMLQKATGFYGQTYTHYQPGFAPLSGTRDVLERPFHIANRDYITADGKTVEGQTLLGDYFTNVARAPMTLFKALRGTLAEDSKAAQYWKEYNDNGLHQVFSPAKKQPSAADLLNRKPSIIEKWSDRPQAKWIKQYAMRMGNTGKTLLHWLDVWNDYFQNISSFAHYTTLRDAGIAPREASHGVLDLMNMTQQGSLTQYVGALAPFVRPTTQSALAMARTLGFGATNWQDVLKTGKRGWIGLTGAIMAYSVLAPIIRESLGYNEKGDAYADNMSISQLTGSIPIGLGDGSYIKAPSGFGLQRLAAALVWGMDKMGRGLMSPSDVAYEVLFAAGRDIAPGNWPQYGFKEHPGEFVMNMICPAPLTPLLQLNENLSFFGSPIHNDGNSNKLRSEQGKTTTPRAWHQAARMLHNYFGMDVYPESIQYMTRALALGPVNVLKSLLTGFADDDPIRKNGNVPTALEEMTPWLASLGGALWYGKQRSAVHSLYYNAKNELTNLVKESGVDLTAHPKSLKGQELLDWQRQQLIEKTGMSRKDIEDYIALRATETALQSIGREFNNTYKQRWMDMEDSQELKDAFDDVAERSEKLYSDFNAIRYGDR